MHHQPAPVTTSDLTRRAGTSTVGGLFLARSKIAAAEPALIDGELCFSYAQLNERVNRLAWVLQKEYGLRRGDRVAMLSRNCAAYVEVELAAAKLGLIVAAINWRLADPELKHCIALAEPALLLAGAEYLDTAARLELALPATLALGDDYEARLAAARTGEPEPDSPVDPEDPLVILYTSGTTGLPKGAVISHRAMIARAHIIAADVGLQGSDAFVAWAPFFHMVSTDQSLATLLRGGAVIVIDGYRPEQLIAIVEQHEIGWLVLIPGMIEDFISKLRERGTNFRPRGIRTIGAMADLVATHQLAEITTLLNAPYANTFGATETGLAPATASFIGIGETPADLAKTQNSFCEIRLVDEHDNEVPDGEPGECAIRGPSLFSGYWRADETNAKDFRNGWFHMGDVFLRRSDGKLQFMDRAKYMIKSGGENIYPAEIERVLLADERVADAVVVKRADARWSEVPVAAVAAKDTGLRAEELLARCRQELAGYKQPKEIRFVAFDDLPRSTTGKIQRHEVEVWFRDGESGSD